MLKDKMTCLIFSCDKFSDLWNGNIKLFNENWTERDFETYIVTDKETDKKIPDIKILAVGADVEWSDRLAYALKQINTDYVFVTLDDYFLIKPVESDTIEKLVDFMSGEKIDYMRLFPDPIRATREKIDGYKGLYRIENSCEYSVNLYQGIWKKDFLKYCVRVPKNAWHFEVELREAAVEYNARCVVSLNEEYKVLDVVRKGKLLRNAAKYFKEHPGIYDGKRPVNTWWYEFRLGVKTYIQIHTPTVLLPIFRKVLSKLGFKFYSTKTA